MDQERRQKAVRESKELAFRFVECINQRDSDSLAAMMSDGFKFTDVAGEVFTVDTLSQKKKFWDDYFRGYPDYRIRMDMMLSSGTDIAFIGKTFHSHVPRWVEVNETLIWYVGITGEQVSEWRIFCTEGYDL